MVLCLFCASERIDEVRARAVTQREVFLPMRAEYIQLVEDFKMGAASVFMTARLSFMGVGEQRKF